jgi:hypothetical protein
VTERAAVCVAVVGSGSLARAVCSSIATSASPLAVHLIARSAAAAREVCYIANTRAAVGGGRARFDSTPTDLGAVPELASVLARLAPAALIGCASHHSPWERVHTPSAWTDLLDRAGFGATLPLQAAIPITVARALAEASPSSMHVNACYPDAVNSLLAALRLPVLCGVGNAGLIAATLQAELGLAGQWDLQVLAHHHHLHAPEDPADEARAWLRGRSLGRVGRLLAGQRSTSRSLLNEVTGFTAARLLGDLLTGAETVTSLPGPLGLAGGYPVRIVDRRLELNLPPGLDREEAVAWNQRMAWLDGVCVLPSGDVRFSPRAQRELGADLPDVAAGYHVTDNAEVCRRLLELRRRLRSPPRAL